MNHSLSVPEYIIALFLWHGVREVTNATIEGKKLLFWIVIGFSYHALSQRADLKGSEVNNSLGYFVMIVRVFTNTYSNHLKCEFVQANDNII